MDLLNCVFDLFPYLTCVFVGLFIAWYKYITWDFDYWKKQGISGEKPWPVIGTLKPIWIYDFHEQDLAAFQKFGHIHGGFEGGNPVLFVTDPDILKQILVKDFDAFPQRRNFDSSGKNKLLGNMLSVMKGEKWKMVRNTLTPAYTTGKIKQMIPFMNECINSLLESLDSKVENGEIVEFKNQFNIVTLDIIASCAFGFKIDSAKNPDNDFVVAANKVFKGSPKVFYAILILAQIFKWLPTPNPFVYFVNIGNKTIDMRLKNKENFRKDFLQIMLEAEVADDNLSEEGQSSKKTLNRDIILSQIILFLLAGYDTTATTLSFMAYELAQNQDVQNKLIKEIDEVIGNSKDELSYETVMNLPYLDMVISETLRKYPPATRTDRSCIKDGYKIGGAILRSGMVIVIPIYAVHHNPEFYPNPEVFDPERFTTENKAKRHPYTYLPFGIGPRSCIAMRFALIETKLIISRLLCNYRLLFCEETDVPVKIPKGLRLIQPISVNLKLQRRT